MKTKGYIYGVPYSTLFYSNNSMYPFGLKFYNLIEKIHGETQNLSKLFLNYTLKEQLHDKEMTKE